MHPHRLNALDGAAAALTVTLRRGVAVSLSWSWSDQPQRRRAARGQLHPRAAVSRYIGPYPVEVSVSLCHCQTHRLYFYGE